jgi:hypothetical protein
VTEPHVYMHLTDISNQVIPVASQREEEEEGTDDDDDDEDGEAAGEDPETGGVRIPPACMQHELNCLCSDFAGTISVLPSLRWASTRSSSVRSTNKRTTALSTWRATLPSISRLA